jgi:transposase
VRETGWIVSTRADWVGQSSGLLVPQVETVRRHVMAAQKLYAHGTPVSVSAPGLGKTKTGLRN